MSPTDKNGNDKTIELGHGVFGRCQKRNYKGIPVAVKVFNNLSSPRDVSHEAAVMAKCSHSSVPHIFGVNVTQKPYFLVSYFYGIQNSSCTLFHALHSRSMSLSKSTVGKIILQLCQALKHLHSKRLLHRDIKCDNILLTMVNKDYHPMLIDYHSDVWCPFKTKVVKCTWTRRIQKETSTHSTRNCSWSATIVCIWYIFIWPSYVRCQQ